MIPRVPGIDLAPAPAPSLSIDSPMPEKLRGCGGWPPLVPPRPLRSRLMGGLGTLLADLSLRCHQLSHSPLISRLTNGRESLPSAGITRLQRYCGPFRHPAWPGLPLTGCRLARARHLAGFPALRLLPSSMHATASTPAKPTGARVAGFPTVASLPRDSGGSAFAWPVSRPARRSPALRPARSLNRPRRRVPSKCFSPCC